jgi:hypothetical protein
MYQLFAKIPHVLLQNYISCMWMRIASRLRMVILSTDILFSNIIYGYA